MRVRLTFDELPLFPSGKQIARALFGDDKSRVQTFLHQLPIEERHGFPRKHPTYGTRYKPSVKAHLDYEAGLSRDAPPAAWDQGP